MRKLILSSVALIGLAAAPAQAQSVGSIINSVFGGYGYQPYGYSSYGYQPAYGYQSYGYAPVYGYQRAYAYQPYGYQPYAYQRSYSRGYNYAYGSPVYYGCKPRRHHRNGVVYYTRGC